MSPAPRPAERRELDQLAALYAELVVHHGGAAGLAPGPDAESAARDHLRAALGHPDAHLLVAPGARGPEGFVLVRVLERPPLYAERRRGEIEAVFVREEARRAGVGRALVDAALAWLRARGIRRVALQVGTENPGGRGFWAALGFRPVMEELSRELPD